MAWHVLTNIVTRRGKSQLGDMPKLTRAQCVHAKHAQVVRAVNSLCQLLDDKSVDEECYHTVCSHCIKVHARLCLLQASVPGHCEQGGHMCKVC